MGIDDSNPRALNCYANILKKLGKLEEAVSHYIKAIENSQNMGVFFKFFRVGIFSGFVGKEYKAMLHFNLGLTLFLLDKIFFALKELDRALIIEVKIGDYFMKKG